jgi:hypothetical protein
MTLCSERKLRGLGTNANTILSQLDAPSTASKAI